MFSRRSLLCLAASSPIALTMRQNRYEVGDLVRLVKLLTPFPTASTGLAKVNRWYRLCLGKTSRVIYIGDDGRPELDVSEHVSSPFEVTSGGRFGVTLSLDPSCLALVKRGVPFQIPAWAAWVSPKNPELRKETSLNLAVTLEFAKGR